MAGHQDRPDIMQRRRLTRLRADLGLGLVPPHIGVELRAIAPRVSEQAARLLRHEGAYSALTPAGQALLLAALGCAVDEFACLVEDRHPDGPTVEAMLVEIVDVQGQPEPCRAALLAMFQTVHDVTRVLWPQLPHARSCSTQLDAALARYAERLCTRTMTARRAPSAGTVDTRPVGTAHLDGLLALVELRWGTRPSQLYVSVSAPGSGNIPSQRGAAPRATTRPLRLVTIDHVVIVSEHPIPPQRPVGPAHPPLAVCVGPVPASGLTLVHDTALLLLRLIAAGVAAPPSPVLIHMPNLGFLHPSPSADSVLKITELLLPLTKQASHRRITLARTLQLRLRTAAPAQGLARQLAMHPQTVHNHLAALRGLYNPDLDFADETLAMQAALDLVLPLWELEAARRRSSWSPNPGRLVAIHTGTGELDLP